MSLPEPVSQVRVAVDDQDERKQDQDLRLRATGYIWRSLLVALGLCIPLVAITDSGPLLPLVALGGASIATIVVWKPNVLERSARQPVLPANQPALQQTGLMGSLLGSRRDDFLLALLSAVVGAVLSAILKN